MAKKPKRKPSKKPSLKIEKDALSDERSRIQALMYNDKIGPEKKIFLAEYVTAQVKKDIADRQDYMNTRREILDMYEGIAEEEKKHPFENCADVRTMIVAMTAELLHSRLFPLAYNEDLTYWVPQEKSDIPQAEGVSKFMPWANRRCGFKDFADDYTMALILEGTNVTKVIWDEEWRWVARKIPKIEAIKKKVMDTVQGMFRNEIELDDGDYKIEYEYIKLEHARCELVPLDDVGFPTDSIPGSDENKLDHIWHRTRPTVVDLRQKARLGYFEGIAKVTEKIITTELEEGELAEERADAEGVTVGVENELILSSKKVELIEWYGKVEISGEGLVECIVWIEAKTKTFLGIMPLLHLSRKNRRPFVIAQFIRRMNRMYGKTILEFIMELEKEVNSIHNQRLDLGTMSIIPPLFYQPNNGIEPEDIEMRPGICIPVDEINSVKWMQMPNNVMVSFQEERLLMDLIEKITSVGSYQSGQESNIAKSGATARGTMAIIAQGEQRFQTLSKRLKSPLGKIQKKMLEAYQENIPPGLEKRVLGEDSKPIFPKGLSAEDLIGNFDVIHGDDATGGLKLVKTQNDDQIYMMYIQNPYVLNNPGGLWELSAEPLRNRGRDPEVILGPKPDAQAEKADTAKSIRKCISEIRQGRMPKYEDGTNPMELLTALLAYKNTPQALALDPEKRALLDMKIEKTRLELLNQSTNAQSMAEVAGGMRDARIQGTAEGNQEDRPGGDGVAPRMATDQVEAEGSEESAPGEVN